MAVPSIQADIARAGMVINQHITVKEFGPSALRIRGDLMSLFAVINSDSDLTKAAARAQEVISEEGTLKYLGGNKASYLHRATKETVGDVALRVEARVKPKKGDKSAKAVVGQAATWVFGAIRKATSKAGLEGGEKLPYSHSALRLVHEFKAAYNYARGTSVDSVAAHVISGSADIKLS